MSTDIVPFDFEGAPVRIAVIDGDPWWVLSDVARALGLGNASAVAARLDADEKGLTQIETLGGIQSVGIVNEPGFYSVVLRSDKPAAKRLKRFVTHEVLPAIRKTGSYVAPAAPKSQLDVIREQHEAIGILLEATEKATFRAVVAEKFKDSIEHADGLTPREFHKHYLSDIGEREFFEFLYKRGLLIDQRGQRRDSRGQPKAGRQHAHPSFSGKAFFYLHPTVDQSTGDRYENTRVRPGAPEIALVQYCAARGLTANRNADRALEIVK
jgi:prophage antirepressor-like protein